MKRLLLLPLLTVTACAAPEAGDDPCDVTTGGVTLHAEVPPEVPASLNCTGGDLACSGEVRVTKAACVDGFAVTLESGNATLVLRLKGGEGWTAGARLNDVEHTGSLKLSGLYDPSEPAPPTGQKQRGSFVLNATETVADGTFSLEW